MSPTKLTTLLNSHFYWRAPQLLTGFLTCSVPFLAGAPSEHLAFSLHSSVCHGKARRRRDALWKAFTWEPSSRSRDCCPWLFAFSNNNFVSKKLPQMERIRIIGVLTQSITSSWAGASHNAAARQWGAVFEHSDHWKTLAATGWLKNLSILMTLCWNRLKFLANFYQKTHSSADADNHVSCLELTAHYAQDPVAAFSEI